MWAAVRESWPGTRAVGALGVRGQWAGRAIIDRRDNRQGRGEKLCHPYLLYVLYNTARRSHCAEPPSDRVTKQAKAWLRRILGRGKPSLEAPKGEGELGTPRVPPSQVQYGAPYLLRTAPTSSFPFGESRLGQAGMTEQLGLHRTFQLQLPDAGP